MGASCIWLPEALIVGTSVFRGCLLKAIVAKIAIAVLLVVGYSVLAEWSAFDGSARAEQELFELAKAEPGETFKVWSWCSGMADRLASDTSDEFAGRVVRNCRGHGYLTY